MRVVALLSALFLCALLPVAHGELASPPEGDKSFTYRQFATPADYRAALAHLEANGATVEEVAVSAAGEYDAELHRAQQCKS